MAFRFRDLTAYITLAAMLFCSPFAVAQDSRDILQRLKLSDAPQVPDTQPIVVPPPPGGNQKNPTLNTRSELVGEQDSRDIVERLKLSGVPQVPRTQTVAVPPPPSGNQQHATDNNPAGPTPPLPFVPEPVPAIPEASESLSFPSIQQHKVHVAPQDVGGTDASAGRQLTRPWWADEMQSPNPGDLEGWELDQLVWLAVAHSPFVEATLTEPRILTARAAVELGEFDTTTFVDTIFNDTSDPVGNTLITGTSPRLNDHIWDNKSGFRRKNVRGGQTEFAQSFLFKDSNSDFFVPGNQADTKMLLRYTQPLMRGAGVDYNRSSYVVASLNANQSGFEANLRIQEHVFEITRAYWELYSATASAKQIERGLQALIAFRNKLQGRDRLDALRSQLMRADAAIARQNANLARLVAQKKAAEATLRSLVAAPQLLENREQPILVSTPPLDRPQDVERQEELARALGSHPSIQATQQRLKSARVRLKVAEQDLRPTLDLVLEGYIRGLNGDFDAAKSFGDQFSRGAPSYSAGLSYARPYRKVAAKHLLRERRLELQRVLAELDHTLLTVNADVVTAIAQVEAAFVQLESSVRSTLATHEEVEYLNARWSNSFIDNSQRSLLLDQLLNAEVQLIQSENSWARAQADHMIALARLRRATGQLMPMTEF